MADDCPTGLSHKVRSICPLGLWCSNSEVKELFFSIHCGYFCRMQNEVLECQDNIKIVMRILRFALTLYQVRNGGFMGRSVSFSLPLCSYRPFSFYVQMLRQPPAFPAHYCQINLLIKSSHSFSQDLESQHSL